MIQAIRLVSYVVFLIGFFSVKTPLCTCGGGLLRRDVVNHEIEIELYPDEHRLRATDRLTFQHAGTSSVSCLLNGTFEVLSVRHSGQKLDFMVNKQNFRRKDAFNGIQYLEIKIPPSALTDDLMSVDIAYEGFFPTMPGSLREEDVGHTIATISESGTYLSPSSLWYPTIPQTLGKFRVTIISPVGYESITHGILTDKKKSGGKIYTTWEEENVLEGCFLVAGQYQITSIVHSGINIYAYFFPEEQSLAEIYIQASKDYLDMYEGLLGTYPYRKFAVVENFFQTGYGMPSFTLLGSAVVKLPFIVKTSLGHEILHNWWGNSVFVDESQGNWCEGLTTYMADYYYKELEGPGLAREYRQEICRKYTNYVTDENDFPVSGFHMRTDKVTQAIGYGKTAMIFHMLRQMTGDEMFFKSLRKFYKEKKWQWASWADIRTVFQDTSSKDLLWFFEQWVNRKGAPVIELGETQVEKAEDGWLVEAEILQKGTPFRLSLPVSVETEDTTVFTVVEINDNVNNVSVFTTSRPKSIFLDPQNNIFRRLHKEEIPATLDFVMGDSDKIFVYPAGGGRAAREAYKQLASFLAGRDGIVKADTEVTGADISHSSLFIFGGISENKLTGMFKNDLPEGFLLGENAFSTPGKQYRQRDNILTVAFRNPKNREKGIVLFLGLGAGAIQQAGFKLPHYGKYSYLVFEGGKNIDKGIFTVDETPLQRKLKSIN